MDLYRWPGDLAAPGLEVELLKVIPHRRRGGAGSAAGAAKLISSAGADCPAFVKKTYHAAGWIGELVRKQELTDKIKDVALPRPLTRNELLRCHNPTIDRLVYFQSNNKLVCNA